MPLSRIAVVLALSAATAGAQQRTIEPHPISDPQGALMGYYSALVIFAPDGAPYPGRAWTVDLSANLGYVPPLSYDQRTAGRDKPESTNVTELFGLPYLTLWLPDDIAVQAAYTPGVVVNGATPNIYAFAAEMRVGAIGPVEILPRATYTGGYIEGPITCNTSLSTSPNLSFQIYWAQVCHGMPSADRFEPNQWSVELNGTMTLAHGALIPFANIGVVQYRSTFDVRVETGSGIDTDHPILKMNATEGYGSLGASWIVSPIVRLGGAMFWAPGSVFTGRLSATFRLNGR